MKWYSIYCLEVTLHQILIELLHFFNNFLDDFHFPINPPTSFHWIALKLSGHCITLWLNHKVIQCIMFQAYSTPNFDRVIAL